MDTFDLRKYLSESKLTTNLKVLSENNATFLKGLKQELTDVEVEKEDIKKIIDTKNGLGKFIYLENKWIQSGMESEYRRSYSNADELDGIIHEYCDLIGVEFEENPKLLQ